MSCRVKQPNPRNVARRGANSTRVGTTYAVARRRTGDETGAKLALLKRYSSQMLATARRYSDNLDDAEDAYQRAAEILLTNAPDRHPDDMCR